MKDYTTWTKFEINKAVAEFEGLKISKNQYREFGDRDGNCVLVDMHNVGDTVVDYCNNPSDTWPIIFDNRLCITASLSDDYWVASHARKEIECRHKNPLVAAMIVYLMIKDAEK